MYNAYVTISARSEGQKMKSDEMRVMLTAMATVTDVQLLLYDKIVYPLAGFYVLKLLLLNCPGSDEECACSQACAAVRCFQASVPEQVVWKVYFFMFSLWILGRC